MANVTTSEKRKASENVGAQSSQKTRKMSRVDRLLEEIPTSDHYHVSFMHRATVSTSLSMRNDKKNQKIVIFIIFKKTNMRL